MRKLRYLLVAAVLLLVYSKTYAVSVWAPNVSYKIGNRVTFHTVLYQCIQGHTSQTGWEPPKVPALWQQPLPAGIAVWMPQTMYPAGALVDWQDGYWRCLQAHNSQIDWAPNSTPALWGRISSKATSSIGIVIDVTKANAAGTKLYSNFTSAGSGSSFTYSYDVAGVGHVTTAVTLTSTELQSIVNLNGTTLVFSRRSAADLLTADYNSAPISIDGTGLKNSGLSTDAKNALMRAILQATAEPDYLTLFSDLIAPLAQGCLNGVCYSWGCGAFCAAVAVGGAKLAIDVLAIGAETGGFVGAAAAGVGAVAVGVFCYARCTH